MFNITKRKKKGFSLLELLLVFGIIAALIVGVFMILSVDAVIKSKIVPEDIVDDNLIWDSWGANVLIEPYYDGSFYIGFENVSVDACPKFVSQAGASFFKIVVGSREVKNTEANQDLDMATLANACISNDDGYSGRPITVYFYDK